MKDKKLPNMDRCKEFAYHVAEDYGRTIYKNDNRTFAWFSDSQLESLINFCKGNPVQNELWDMNEREEQFTLNK